LLLEKTQLEKQQILFSKIRTWETRDEWFWIGVVENVF